jgi:hypothetical protein
MKPNCYINYIHVNVEKLKLQQVVEALRMAQGMVYVAADRLGVQPKTIYNYAKRHATVREAIENARGRFLDTGEIALQQAVLRGEGWAVCFLLKTLGKHRGYVERHELDQQISGGDSLIAGAIAALTGRSMGHLLPSGEDQNIVDGETLGEDDSRSVARNNGGRERP